MSSSLKPGQLTALQTIWSQYARRSLDVPKERDREERLRWASENAGRKIESFKELTRDEAAKCIDTLQLALGRQPNERVRPQSQQAARAAGTHGRRGTETNEIALATARDFARIQEALTRLGWDRTRFDAWLQSPSSPFAKRACKLIRTVADANSVWWALKRILKRAGLWTQQPQGNK
jgi:hypothetical protein